MRFRSPVLSWVLASALALGPLLGASTRATQAKPPDPAARCGQRGKVTFDKDTTLSDASGRKIARFSGGESAVTLLAPPGEGSDLARIETGTGRGSFRLNGFVKANELRIYTSYTVPVVSGHVWIGAGTRVTAAGMSGGKVRIEKQVSSPFNQRFTGFAECSALTFAPPTPPGFAMPGNARVYLMKVSLLDLYSDMPPTGSPITTLKRSPLVDSVRFFSTEQRGGFVHVQYHGEVNVDGWAKASDLVALPRGETSDLPPSSYTLTSPPQLQLPKTPRTVTTNRELPLRVAARDADPPVGVIEPETEVYVMDTVAGWANVLPESLHVLPADNLSFWVKASDLGL
ncbi:MAG TPA: hypothetical protein VJN18_08575 [Polyangiaceae bacterium]|nr:hypothetical protein [Polyangiaceae bacterium]